MLRTKSLRSRADSTGIMIVCAKSFDFLSVNNAYINFKAKSVKYEWHSWLLQDQFINIPKLKKYVGAVSPEGGLLKKTGPNRVLSKLNGLSDLLLSIQAVGFQRSCE